MNCSIRQIISLFVVGLSLFSSSASAQICQYVPLEPKLGKITANDFSVDFGQGDDASKPQAWQGPLAISRSDNTSCTVDPDVSILERPFYQDSQHLLVTTYSGSKKIVFVINVATCRILWQSKPFTGKISLNGSILKLGKKTVGFDAHCIPNLVTEHEAA